MRSFLVPPRRLPKRVRLWKNPGIAAAQELLDLPRIPEKTVYVLGAGFSALAGMPMIGNFLPRGLALLKTRIDGEESSAGWADDDNKDLIKQVTEVMDRHRRALMSVREGDPTIEDLFSIVHLLSGPNGKEHEVLAKFVTRVCHQAYLLHEAKPSPDCFVARAHLKKRSQIHAEPDTKSTTSHARLPGVCVYRAFLSQVLGRPAEKDKVALPNHLNFPVEDVGGYAGPAIISLNYDLVVERKLMAGTLGKTKQPRWFYGAQVNNRDPVFTDDAALPRVPLIKLHGSINWSAVKGAADMVSAQIPKLDAVASIQPADPAPLIYPTWLRSPGVGTVFGKLLDEAYLHLRLASRIVFIGYSLPPSDKHIALLLAHSLDTAEPVEIVTANQFPTDAFAQQRIGELLGARARSCFTKNYPQGLKELVTDWTDPSSLMAAQ